MYRLNHMRMPVYNTFFSALKKAHEQGMDIEEIHVNNNEYCSLYSRKGGRKRSYIYDIFTDRVRREEVWRKDCAANHAGLEKENLDVLASHGIRDAYLAAMQWLTSGKTIRTLNMRTYPCPDPFFIEERNLEYGCVITGFSKEKKGIVWRITLFDRAVKENDCIRGMDTAYLLYDGKIHEAVMKNEKFELLEDRDTGRGTKYRYVAIGAFKDASGHIHGITIPTATLSNSREQAENGCDKLEFWFKNENGRIVLETVLCGFPIYGYNYDKFLSRGGKIYSLNRNPGIYNLGEGLRQALPEESEENLSFDDLFTEQMEAQGRVNIDVIGHYIEEGREFYDGL